MVVSGAIEERASFYPGLTITAGGGGSVYYSWTGGSGTVSSGRTEVVYVPQGTEVALRAAPSSFLYSFGGWGAGAPSSAESFSSTVVSPEFFAASFSLNVNVLAVALGGVVAVAAAISLAIRRRRSKRGGTPDFNPPHSAPMN